MHLKPLLHFFYRLLFLLPAESRSFNNPSSIVSSSKELGIDESDDAYLNFSENNSFILPESLLEANVGCAVINPYFIENLSQYESLLEEHSDYPCEERKSREMLLLRKMPIGILDAITEKKMELKIPCDYDPLSENMPTIYVNNRFNLQQILIEDLLRLRLNYWINYYKSCLPKDYAEISISLKGNGAIISDCKSLEIVKKLLPALYAVILDTYLATDKINIPELELDLRHLVKIHSNKLSKEYKKGTLIQCQINNIDYTLRGRKGLKFLLHNFATQTINKLLLPEISLQSCDNFSSIEKNYFNASSPSIPACLKTPLALTIHEKLQNYVNNQTLAQSHLLSHCGKHDYELFKLGTHLEEKKEINETLNCLFNDRVYSISTNKSPVFIRKLVDQVRNDYILNCTSSFISDKTLEQSKTNIGSNIRFKRANLNNKDITYKSQLNKIKPCQTHELVQAALDDTIINIIQMNSLDTESSCLELTKKIFETASKAEFKANWSLSTSKEQCSSAPNRIAKPTYSNLMVAYNKVLRKWMMQHVTSCVERHPNHLPLSFAFRVGEVFCFKLTLPLVEHHFKLMLKQPEIIGSIVKDHPKFDFVLEEQDAKLNMTFKDLLEEESLEGSLARQHLAEKNPILLQKIPLELFLYFLPLEKTIDIENFLTSPVIFYSSSATQKACYNYFMGTMFFKKVENLFKNLHDSDNNEIALKDIHDFSKKSKKYFEKHKVFTNKFGNPNEKLFQLSFYEKDPHLKKSKREITNQVSFFQEFSDSVVSTEKQDISQATSTFPSKLNIDENFSCDISLEKYLNFVTPTDSMKNMAFKNSIISAFNCEEKNAFNQMLLALPEVEENIEGEELKFQSKFHAKCSNSPKFKSMMFGKIIETTEREECKREKMHKSLTLPLLH